MSRRFLSMFILALMLLTGSTLASEPIDLATLRGRIAYSYEDDIYVMDADGSSITRLTSHPEADFDPAWSPDGTRIAFRSRRDSDEEIYVMNADGTAQTNLTNHPTGDWSPEWSPDGMRIAFATTREGGMGIWILNVADNTVEPVASPPGVNDYPTWSPDSQRIAWNCTLGRYITVGGSSREGDFEICVVNVDGTGLQQLTDTEGTNKFPAWSPDGAQIAFVSTRDGWSTLPEYTPDEYEATNYGDDEIYIMNADGSDQHNLTNHPREGDTFPAWSPDGYIAFTRHGGCIMVMRPDGTGVTQINRGTCADGGHFVSWALPHD